MKTRIRVCMVLLGLGLVFLFGCGDGGDGGGSAGSTFRDCDTCPEMVVVPGGSFMMGRDPNFEDGNNDELPQHKVTVESFSMGKTEVTQAEWVAVMGNNPSQFRGQNNPVENVSWDDAQAFIRKLNQKTGKTYRLPSEAEWEYAARAGTTTKWSCGSDEGCLNGVAWYDGNANSQTHPVGGKSANGFGLYDMHGNVYEWVADCYHDSYQGAPTNGSVVTTGDCSLRVLRGGSWGLNQRFLRSASRDWNSPGGRYDVNGFRLARTVLP